MPGAAVSLRPVAGGGGRDVEVVERVAGNGGSGQVSGYLT